MAILIGFSAGMMLATAFFELLPEALEKANSQAFAGVGVGFMMLYIVERITHFHACRNRGESLGHHSCDAAEETEELLEGVDHALGHVHTHATTTLLGVGLHNFIDGLITAAAFSASHVAGVLVIGALILHQVPVGISLGALLLRVGTPRRQVAISTAIIGSFIVWGALLYAFLPVTKLMGGFLLGVAGGSFLYIGACDLLPEAHHKDEGLIITAATVLGFTFAYGMTRWFPHGV
jgi:zinc transporter ZupT